MPTKMNRLHFDCIEPPTHRLCQRKKLVLTKIKIKENVIKMFFLIQFFVITYLFWDDRSNGDDRRELANPHILDDIKTRDPDPT